MAPLVTIQHLAKTFGTKDALHDISAEIHEGTIVALAGPDASGKTTLIRLIAGLLLPTKGEICVFGKNTKTEAEKIQEMIGYMPQKFGLYEDLTVLENLTLYSDLKGVTREERKNVFEKLLAFTKLAPFTQRLAKNLSGGMKQKLGLACTLLQKPKLLLLDEPTVGVDPLSRKELWIMIENLLKENISILWSTSYLDEAERCDRVILLSEGRALFQGKPIDLTKRVENRVFKIHKISTNHRQVLKKIFQNERDLVDGMIQGSDVRIVIKDPKKTINPALLDAGKDVECVPTQPRFEDAFVDILGGAHQKSSLLAEKMEQIPVTKKDLLIEAKELTKKFGNFTAADHVSFQVYGGEVFGLLGPNGAGKSTTFKMLCGLLRPTYGEAYVNGLHLQKFPAVARSQIGYMAQKFSLYGGLSVLQNLEFFSGVYNLVGKKRKEMMEEMISIFNLTPFLDQSAEILPLGFKQRLALACSMMHHPKILFLDEPTSGVDPLTRREFWNHINGIVEKGTTVMLTTHFINEAENCDRIALIYQSKLISMGTPDELKEKAKSEKNIEPTLEDAFIRLIEQYDQDHKV